MQERVGIAVLGSSCFVPDRVIPQKLVEEMLGLELGFSEKYLGVKERRSYRDPQTLQWDTDFPYPEVEMAYLAAERALEDAGVNRDEITDLVAGFEVTSKIPGHLYGELALSLPADLDKGDIPRIPTNFMPPPGFLLARMLGLKHAWVQEFYGGCADLLNGAILAPRPERKALIVGSSVPSIGLPFERTDDLGILINQLLFGDGAAAMVLDYEGTDLDKNNAHMVDFSKNPLKGPRFIDRGTGRLTEFGKAVFSDKEYHPVWYKLLKIDHRLVFNEGPKALMEIIGDVLTNSGSKTEDIARFLIHQASRPTCDAAIQFLGEQFGVPPGKVPTNYQRYGNTGLASPLILYDEERRQGRINAGDKVVMAGIGPGFRANALLLEAA